VSGLTWKIPRGAVIRGRVVDDRGRPMSDAPIVLMQYRETDSGRALQSAACCVWPQTDGDGAYRVTGVPAGEYLVAALPPGGYVYMPEPFVPSGPETRQVTAAELQWALKELAGPSGASEPPSGPAVTYTRMFFPGSADPASATPVQVALGEERGGIDIAMRLLPSARIQGRVVGPDGQPVERPQVSMSGSSSTAPGSAFSRRNLTPGRYTITARGANNTLWGRVTLDVNGTDLLDVEIKLGTCRVGRGHDPVRVGVETASGGCVGSASVTSAGPVRIALGRGCREWIVRREGR
jgi:hypothetical protein